MEEKLLTLILEKLDGIEKEQKKMSQEQQEMKKEQQEMKKEQQEMKKEQQEMKKEQQGMKKVQQGMKEEQHSILQRLDRLEQGQEVIKEFMYRADQYFKMVEEDHRFIERLKKAIGE